MSHPDVPSRAEPVAGHSVTGTDRAAPTRPGWPEILAGVAVFVVLSYGGVPLIKQIGLDPLVHGLILTAWSGIVGVAGAVVAKALRRRSWAAFGGRRPSWRWVALGAGAGVAAWLLSRIAVAGYVALTGDTGDVQRVYTETGAAGVPYLILSLLFLTVLTPFGEELLFRGVVATALMRYGPVVGVAGSAVVFAAVHGPNAAAVTAAVVGLINAVLLRRSGSIWPGVVAHAVNNLIGIGVGVALAATT